MSKMDWYDIPLMITVPLVVLLLVSIVTRIICRACLKTIDQYRKEKQHEQNKGTK